MHNIKAFLANLSHHPGVYQMLGKEGDVLYVGKAKDLKSVSQVTLAVMQKIQKHFH